MTHDTKRVVTSSTEAECSALTTIGKENTWQRRMYGDMMDIGQDFPPSDNTASISMVSTGVTKRSRHFSIEWFKVKDLIENGELKVSWVCTEDNLADFFTKKLARQRFCYLRDKTMGSKEKQDYFLEKVRAHVMEIIHKHIAPEFKTIIDSVIGNWASVFVNMISAGGLQPRPPVPSLGPLGA